MDRSLGRWTFSLIGLDARRWLLSIVVQGDRHHLFLEARDLAGCGLLPFHLGAPSPMSNGALRSIIRSLPHHHANVLRRITIAVESTRARRGRDAAFGPGDQVDRPRDPDAPYAIDRRRFDVEASAAVC